MGLDAALGLLVQALDGVRGPDRLPLGGRERVKVNSLSPASSRLSTAARHFRRHLRTDAPKRRHDEIFNDHARNEALLHSPVPRSAPINRRALQKFPFFRTPPSGPACDGRAERRRPRALDAAATSCEAAWTASRMVTVQPEVGHRQEHFGSLTQLPRPHRN